MIYYIQCNDYIKIGYTSNLKSRMKDYVTENPYPTKLLHLHNGGYDIERKIHKELKAYKHRGEWFHYNQKVKDKIALILIDNAANTEPTKAKARRDKHKHLITLMALKQSASAEGVVQITKEIRQKICSEVEIVQSTFSRHLLKLEKLKRITRIDSLIYFT